MIEFKLDKKNSVPFYRQIVDLVLAGISSRRIGPGERLPTIRDLAVRLEVNPNTVVKAYTELQLLDVLDTQQGSGVFVRAGAGKVVAKEDRTRIAQELCLDFVGRAQLLHISVDDLLACLSGMKVPKQKEKSR
jgi:GntR family transcriptional regulator